MHTTATTPAPIVLVSGPDVWMEGEATRQLAMLTTIEGCVHVAGMPDLHPGRGFPIGAVVATRDVVHPRLVGGDAGCGVRLVATTVDRMNPDKLERRLRAAFEDELFADVDGATLFEAVWREGARGLAAVDGVPEGLRRLAALEP
ncbi:MAG: RtcB family protein, partial [Myxococcota bacterium]|nr:RtcB family protein [Myxococcota bacterium]